MLKLIILLAVVTYVYAASCTNCIKFNAFCYEKKQLLDLPGPFTTKNRDQMVHTLKILKTKNILFYSFNSNVTTVEGYYKIGFVYLDNTTRNGVIEDYATDFHKTFDIDQDSEVLYFGCSDGVYYLNLKKRNMLCRGNVTTEYVVATFFKETIYFVRNNEDAKIQYSKNGDFVDLLPVKKVSHFVIDELQNIVFLNNTGLFITDGQEYKKLSDIFVKGLVLDNNFELYAWFMNTVYKVKDKKFDVVLQEVATFKAENPNSYASFQMTFDRDNNIYYVVGKSLYKLTKKLGYVDC